jgi:hypothetical protein
MAPPATRTYPPPPPPPTPMPPPLILNLFFPFLALCKLLSINKIYYVFKNVSGCWANPNPNERTLKINYFGVRSPT